MAVRHRSPLRLLRRAVTVDETAVISTRPNALVDLGRAVLDLDDSTARRLLRSAGGLLAAQTTVRIGASHGRRVTVRNAVEVGRAVVGGATQVVGTTGEVRHLRSSSSSSSSQAERRCLQPHRGKTSSGATCRPTGPMAKRIWRWTTQTTRAKALVVLHLAQLALLSKISHIPNISINSSSKLISRTRNNRASSRLPALRPHTIKTATASAALRLVPALGPRCRPST